MIPAETYTHAFVRSFPDRLEEGVLYVSVEFSNTAHRCMCGCGEEVYAPLTPRDWTMLFDGETVSLDPSIGNWSFLCRSHYWLERGRVSWALQWSSAEIERGRALDRIRKLRHYGEETCHTGNRPPIISKGFASKILTWLFRG